MIDVISVFFAFIFIVLYFRKLFIIPDRRWITRVERIPIEEVDAPGVHSC